MKRIGAIVVVFMLVCLSALSTGSHSASASTLTVSVPDTQSLPGSTVTIPINVSNAGGIAGGNLTITFNASILTATEVTATALTGGFALTKNLGIPGEVHIALASATAISDPSHTGGALVSITFAVSASAGSGATSPLTLTQAVIRDVDAVTISSTAQNGTFTVQSQGPMYTLTTTASPLAGGSVSRSPNQSSYASGTVVTLTANPTTGYTCSGWSGDLTGSTNPTTITMDANKTVTATFTPSSETSFPLSLLPSWNVIAVPFPTPVSLLPSCDLFLSWDGFLWQPATTLLPGTGYLVRNTTGATTVVLTGTPSSSPQTQPATGTWQIIGNPYTTPASFTCTTSVPYLLFWDGSLWQLASPTNLPPGLGFLLHASSPGTISLTRLP
jgi:uncharacterized repeat protein (TIGR02543 family)